MAPTTTPAAEAAVPGDRGRRLEHAERAYQIQKQGGIQGMIKYTIYGTMLATLGHYTWPAFRKQTLALKGFLVSSATIVGLVFGAENNLLRFESHQRQSENDLRRQARNELAREGVIATETEIRLWKERREAKLKEAELLGAKVESGAEKDGLDPLTR